MAATDKDPPGEPPSPARALELARAGRHGEAEDAYAVYVAAHPNDARALAGAGKSIPPALLAPLFATPGVEFVSLHAGSMGALADFGALAPRVVDFADAIRDFGDTAAIIDGLDLVIAVDTPAAHVAGAMNKPVWLLDRFHTSWRWRGSDRHSAWYPSLAISGRIASSTGGRRSQRLRARWLHSPPIARSRASGGRAGTATDAGTA